MIEKINVLNVFYVGGSEKHLMGRLALKKHQIFFEYNTDFLKTGLELSPFKLPLKSGVMVCEDRLFEGIWGLFNDSLPDGWGRLLLDRQLKKAGINAAELSALDRLSHVGHHGMGALVYEPETSEPIAHLHFNLDEIADEVLQFQENNDDRFIDDLLAMNGSSAGARPKIMMNFEGNDWIIKFASSLDPIDIGPIEFAYHKMAESAGLDVPEARLFPSQKGPGYFGVRRFDRSHGQRKHMHTISGLLHADHRIPSLDYETILKASLLLTENIHEGEKQFKRAVFNVFTHNRDDHAKNFSFLMDEKGKWSISPAYDLTFSSGPGGEHCTTMMGEGKNPSRVHLLKLAEISGIKKETAINMIDEVQLAVQQWDEIAHEVGVTRESRELIQSAFKTLINSS